MLNKTQKIKRNNRFIARIIDGGLVTLDPTGGNLFTLNPVATCIWQCLWKTRTLEEIMIVVVKKFSVPPNKIQNDVFEFLEKALKEKLFIKS